MFKIYIIYKPYSLFDCVKYINVMVFVIYKPFFVFSGDEGVTYDRASNRLRPLLRQLYAFYLRWLYLSIQSNTHSAIRTHVCSLSRNSRRFSNTERCYYQPHRATGFSLAFVVCFAVVKLPFCRCSRCFDQSSITGFSGSIAAACRAAICSAVSCGICD